ncbi:hypothetical protein CRYUN_Cryun35bG0061700 [Craigia yunnanensis]
MSANRAEGQQFPPLTRQTSSLYNLTFDEVQSQRGKIGKPLNAMNLDELLRSVIALEEGGLVQNPSSSSASFFLGNFNLNGTISKKTVDEVWKEIVDRGNVNAMDNQFVQQQLTLGQTTLEDFLVSAGVINSGSQDGVLNPQQFMAFDPMAVVSQQADWLQFQRAAVQQQQQQMTMMDSNFNVPESAYENQVVDVGYPENQLAITMPMPAMSATSSDSQPTTGRKHRYSDVMEKTIERRQKRMIKNRESAARSRARKQAYTNQLELEVDQLRKMNSWLIREKIFLLCAVQMETKKGYVELMFNQGLLTYAWGTLLTLLASSARLQAQLFAPQALLLLLIATQGEYQESCLGGHESEAVDAEGDGDEDNDNDDDDGGYGEGDEEDPSDEDRGADQGNNPNDANGNSKKGTEGGGNGAGEEDGKEEEEENDNDDSGDDDEPEDGDDDDDDDDDDEGNEGVDEEEKEIVKDEEPEDEEDEEDEEESVQPPKKRKK